MSQIQIRIDEKTKKQAQHILEELGLDLTSAIKIYLKQIIVYEGIPLKLVTKSGLTISEEKAIIKASREAKTGKKVTVTHNWKEVKAHLDLLKSKQ